eukprot:TRINITY_DN14926_c0_g1_i1.p1 TRINITY_DN14926_c0_g1~~TRINITY_DN14926_c0_g1_i1.p1  ORF type:complete len:307 (+),score=59.07 TRINITY_DN14926_c0_g1_i1:75-923(+)
MAVAPYGGGAVAQAAGPGPDGYVGTIKSFSAKTGYGFITCPEIVAQGGRDVLVGDRVLQSCGFDLSDPWTLKGVRVTFQCKAGKGGHQATLVTRWYRGMIKSFSDNTGYGFISCPELQAQYGCDVHIGDRVLNAAGIEASRALIGTSVHFLIQPAAGGKPRASRVVLDDGAGGYSAPAPRAAPQPAALPPPGGGGWSQPDAAADGGWGQPAAAAAPYQQQAAAPYQQQAAPRPPRPPGRPPLPVGPPPLPHGWVEFTDDNTGLPYYYNESTQETVWVRPAAP